MSAPPFDERQGHRHFAAACFNRAWTYLDLPQRDEAQVEAMLHAAHASMWHWLQVPERTPTNDSIGAWQLARAYAVAGRPDDARRWAARCIEVSETNGLEPFYVGYAYEAMARAERLAGRDDEAVRHLARARALLPRIADGEDRKRLEQDLDAVG